MPNRPTEILNAISKEVPLAWKFYARMLQEHKKGNPDFAWPAWCFCPIVHAKDIISKGQELTTEQLMAMVPAPNTLAAVAAWRPTRGVYRFAPEVYDALISTPIDKMPVEAIYRLPEWSVYIETPGGITEEPDMIGFFAFLEYSVNDGYHKLCFVTDYGGGIDDGSLKHAVVHLSGCETLKEGIKASYDNAMAYGGETEEGEALASVGGDDYAETFISSYSSMVSLLLYLCSEEPDVHPLQAPRGGKPKKPAQILTVTKKQPAGAFFQADRETVWEVGATVQAAMQRARQSASASYTGGGGSMMSPHIRRAHWNHYWTGPRTGQQIAIARWIPPLAINSELADHSVPGTEGEPVEKKF